MRIGLISDTHGYLDEKVFNYFDQCDEIWHAGDIGTIEVAQQLEDFRPLRAVYGNIDGPDLRQKYPEDDQFVIGDMSIWITHIGGSPRRYDRRILPDLRKNPPDIFICGHSHILKVQSDKNHKGMLYLNPGAAGRQGFHRMRTLLRFEIVDGSVQNMQAIELGKRGI